MEQNTNIGGIFITKLLNILNFTHFLILDLGSDCYNGVLVTQHIVYESNVNNTGQQNEKKYLLPTKLDRFWGFSRA